MMPVTLQKVDARLYTADELLRFPGDSHFELIDGRLTEMSPAGDWHGAVTINLSSEIVGFVDRNDLGRCFAAETGFLLARDPDVVLAPDFAFIKKVRLDYPRGRGYVPIAPDLVLETRSPGDRPAKIAAKIARWQSFGVAVILDLDPETQNMIVHRHGEAVVLGFADLFTAPNLLPGFELPLSRLFSR
jgi:Uma2 family endonuclease